MQTNRQYSSFSSNIDKVLKNLVNQLSLLTTMQNAFAKNDAYFNYNFTDTDGISHTYQLPTYNTVLNELEAVKKSINNLLVGQGTIKLGDKVCTIKLNQIATAPPQITQVEQPTQFTLDSNWFFEQLMFPGAVVTIDLSGQLDSTIQKVEICRVIVDSTQTDAEQWWNSISASAVSPDYTLLLTILNDKHIQYSEDIQTYLLPWIHNSGVGTFIVQDDPIKIDGKIWYYIDTINYRTISDAGIDNGANGLLQVGDNLLYNNSLFNVEAIDVTNKAISIRCISGAATPGMGAMFSYYKDPTFKKQVKIRFGVDEYNFIYIKPISHLHGIKANDWSPCIKFDSNKLTYADETSTQFKEFYNEYIVDWGKEMINDAKNKYISLVQSVPVNIPTLDVNKFKITEINSHKSESLSDKSISIAYDEFNLVKSELSRAEQEVSSLRKSYFLDSSSSSALTNLSIVSRIPEAIYGPTTYLGDPVPVNSINSSNAISARRSRTRNSSGGMDTSTVIITNNSSNNSNKYNTYSNKAIDIAAAVSKYTLQEVFNTTKYEKAVNNLSIIRQDYTSKIELLQTEYLNNKITYNPKYRLLGYFDWPAASYIDDDNLKEQHIIQFEIAYRYKTVNNTLPNATQYEAKNSDGVDITLTADEWTTVLTKQRTRTYDKESGRYIWSNDVEELKQIPFVSIPITPNETVEFKVRAISEAGYPSSPRKSEWSATVTKTFEAEAFSTTNLYSNFVSNLEKETIKLIVNQQFTQTGVESHLSDGIANYVHTANNIGYNDTSSYISLLTKIQYLESRITSLETKLARLTSNKAPISSSQNAAKDVLFVTHDASGNIEFIDKGKADSSWGLYVNGKYYNTNDMIDKIVQSEQQEANTKTTQTISNNSSTAVIVNNSSWG